MTEEERLYKQYEASIMSEWMGQHLGPSITQIIEALYNAGYLIDKLVSGTTGVAKDYSIYKCVTGYCSDTEEAKYKFTARMHRDATQYQCDVWLLDDEITLEPIAGW
jgi:hypothetical protein